MFRTGIDPNALDVLHKIVNTDLAKCYYLAGGTACALHMNHRISYNGQLDNTKISFFIYPYPLIDKFVEFEHVNVASIKDLACMKLEAISARGAKRDFVDLYQICQDYSLYQILLWSKQKYREHNISLPHMLKSLVYFTDAEDEPEPNMTIGYNWNQIKSFFMTNVPLVSKQLEII